MADTGAIGVSRRRRDGEAKVRGATRYAADIPVHGLLHARLVLAPEAHARITGIDTGAALEVPGVAAVLTAADLPIPEGTPGRTGEPLARDEVIFSGQPVALVVAETEAAATDGVDAVLVDYEPLPAVLDIEAAMEPDSPLAQIRERDAEGSGVDESHASVGGGEEEVEDEALSDNVVGRLRLSSGDVSAALAESDTTVSGRFRTGWLYQGYLEPQAATAWQEPEGEVVISSGTQGAFSTRKGVADALGLSHDRVRVRPAPLGGAFGGKLFLLEPLAAAAAIRLGRPVRLALTRMEDFAAANPSSAYLVEVTIGATRDGRLTGLRARILSDRGCNGEAGSEGIAARLITGPYRWDAHDVTAYGVVTNRVGQGAYRAPGAPPAAFVLESLVDELAAELELDPIELRLGNVLHTGDPGPDGQPTPVFGAAECLERLRDHPLWQRRDELPDGEGVGVAIGYWPGGLEPAAANCRLDADGGLTIVTGAVDMTGVEATFAAIASEAFGLDEDRVRVVFGDTASAAYSGVSGGSKIIYTVGRAVERAALAARERLLEVAAEELEIAPEDLEVTDGVVRPVGAPGRAIDIAELAGRVLSFGSPHAPIEGHAGIVQRSRAPGSAGHLSHVRVDRETGLVTPVEHVVAQDVGRALNPALVEGQMLGGTTQGFGWALYEELVHDEDGQLRTGSLVDYAMPTFDLVPPIHAEIVEVPAPDGPFGAKGVGEPPVVAVAGAVANAVAAASGVRLRALPMTPDRVWAALSAAVPAR
jgi:CO/xanthine dehydrogenase Mo-binding subunit